MTTLTLPALDGRIPLGFLAALGLTRLLAVHAADDTRLGWSPHDCTAVLHTNYDTAEQVVETLRRIVAGIPQDGVLPGVPAQFPPPGEAPDGLRLDRASLREFAHRLAPAEASETEAWMASLVTDLSLDDRQRADISLMTAPSGKQSMRTMLEKPLAVVREHPEVLMEAITGWRRYPGVTGEYLDHRVLFDAADAPDGRSLERGVPGATWLALMSYPLLRTTGIGGEPVTTTWQRVRRQPPTMVYPLWEPALDLPAITVLCEHPALAGHRDPTVPLSPECRQLGIFTIGMATRRRLPGRNFSGVLAPLP